MLIVGPLVMLDNLCVDMRGPDDSGYDSDCGGDDWVGPAIEVSGQKWVWRLRVEWPMALTMWPPTSSSHSWTRDELLPYHGMCVAGNNKPVLFPA